ncbi:Stk1 family PASTA domain-containing Ser/Thr kinase [Brockia lithotrophica]|uniref:Serine/threonine-protein kinase PrkC n=1 Tax=Brockia lithotrophica TaxID=933949 RepID=A0A660L635_9BACL|nr:Stk1 family PASTA domain-containing Ser/Thr kinase [Brockia lithotrophica]RKQ88795.1 serine/threonine-protein kinase [Brockia lithotrophica]
MKLGDVVGGRYLIRRKLGEGGMSYVYLAEDLLLGRNVAVKVLREPYADDEQFRRRFLREAQAVSLLSHPNIVTLFDTGTHEGAPYLVFEYVPGRTLKEEIRARGPLPLEEVLSIGDQVLRALAHAHNRGIVHRDVKPHNILLTADGTAKVSDFGIARALGGETLTESGTFLGSAHYFSPEQARGETITPASDLYAFGVVLYEMLTGVLPFTGDSPVTVALKHVDAPTPSVRERRPEVPVALENVVRRAMAKRPENRYPSAEAMRLDLASSLDPARRKEPPWEEPDADFPDAEAWTRPFSELSSERTGSSPASGRGGRVVRALRKPYVWGSALALAVLLFLWWGIHALSASFQVPEREVPDVAGMTREEALRALEQAGFAHVDSREEPSDEVEAGKVIAQDPPAGTRLKTTASVLLTLSSGPRKVPVPDVSGLTLEVAKSRFAAFAGVRTEEEFSDSVPAGVVIRQMPAGGTEVVPKQTTVTLVVSKGPKETVMPDVVGRSLEEARGLLARAGFDPDPKVEREKSYFPEGTVIRAWPYQAGEKASPGTKVTLFVSDGLLPDAVEVHYPVTVLPQGGESVDVRISVSDARFTDHTVIRETVNGAKTYEVLLVLAPGKDGLLRVYQNGALVLSQAISYAEAKRGDAQGENGASPPASGTSPPSP